MDMVTKNPVMDEDDDFEKSLEGDMEYAGSVEKRREQQKGALWMFMMPKEPDTKGGNTRTTTIRFLVPYNKGTKILQHEKYAESGAKDGFRYACPAEFGFDCEICAQICKKHKITRDELVESAENIDKYAAKKDWDGVATKFIYLWPVWDYKMRDGEPILRDGKPETPNVRLFGYAFNKNSPVGRIHNLNRTRYVIPQSKGKRGTPITEYDIKITQTGVQTEKTFDALDVDYGDLPEDVVEKVKEYDFSKLALKIAYAMNNTKDEAWLEKYQKLRQEMTPAKPASSAAPKKRTPAALKQEEPDDKYELESDE